MAKMVLNTKNGLVAAIASLARRGQAFKNDAQKVAIAVMEHMDANGDYTSTAVPLFDAIDVTSKNLGMAMREYFLKYTWLAYDEETKTFFKDKSKKMDIKGAQTPIEMADGSTKPNVWYLTERAPKDVPFDAQKAVEQLLKRAAKKEQTGETLAAMKAAIASLEKAQADEIAKAKELVTGE